MNGITMNAMPAGLLAKKGAAKPAMRRQSPVQQTGFGAGSTMAGMSGWLTGAEDDCGWNDMGDTPAHDSGGSVIGLTPVSDKADSLYLHSNGEDWDEAEGYDEDQRAEPGWTPAPVAASKPVAAANPVGAMQNRLREAATPAPDYAHSHAPSFAQPSAYEERAYAEQAGQAPVGLFGYVRAMLAHLFDMIFCRGPVLVVHPDHAMREKIANAAAREGCSEVDIAERAILRYVDPAPKSGFTSSHVMGNA